MVTSVMYPLCIEMSGLGLSCHISLDTDEARPDRGEGQRCYTSWNNGTVRVDRLHESPDMDPWHERHFFQNNTIIIFGFI